MTAKEKATKDDCVHPFTRLHWVNDIVFCNACRTSLTNNIGKMMYSKDEVIEQCASKKVKELEEDIRTLILTSDFNTISDLEEKYEYLK